MRAAALGRGVCLLITLCTIVAFGAGRAKAWKPEGSWIVSDRVAFEIFDCSSMLCGKIVWVRNPALRTAAICGRTIVWNLQPEGDSQWSGGWFYDPENGSTYNISATLQPDGTISARIYEGFAMFGKTEILRRIQPYSLQGWC